MKLTNGIRAEVRNKVVTDYFSVMETALRELIAENVEKDFFSNALKIGAIPKEYFSYISTSDKVDVKYRPKKEYCFCTIYSIRLSHFYAARAGECDLEDVEVLPENKTLFALCKSWFDLEQKKKDYEATVRRTLDSFSSSTKLLETFPNFASYLPSKAVKEVTGYLVPKKDTKVIESILDYCANKAKVVIDSNPSEEKTT